MSWAPNIEDKEDVGPDIFVDQRNAEEVATWAPSTMSNEEFDALLDGAPDIFAELESDVTVIIPQTAPVTQGPDSNPLPNLLAPAPDQEKQGDDDSYEIEAIVDHTELPDGSMEFKVRWTGYDPSYDLWIPDHEIMHSSPKIYSNYMQKLNFKSSL